MAPGVVLGSPFCAPQAALPGMRRGPLLRLLRRLRNGAEAHGRPVVPRSCAWKCRNRFPISRNGPISAPVPGGRPASPMPRHFGDSVGLPSPSLTRLLSGPPETTRTFGLDRSSLIDGLFKRMEAVIDGTVGSLKTANAAIDKGPSSTWFVGRAHLADCFPLKFSHLAEELEPQFSQLDAFIQLDFKESVSG